MAAVSVTLVSASTVTSNTTPSSSTRAPTPRSRPTAAVSWSWARRIRTSFAVPNVVMGAPDQDLVCSAIVALLDQDCAPTAAVGGAASVGPSDGVGPGLVVNANLIM